MAGMFTYPTFDPQISSTDPGGFLLIFDPLINFLVVQENPPKTELRPELAESWKITDPKTAELKLRKGVKFHDGSEWNAEVAKWNLDRIRTHPKSATKANVASINSVDIVDPYTIRLNLKGPSAAIFANLSPAAGPQYMISKAAVDKAGEQEFERNPVGTGAFQFVRWVRDDFVETKRTGKYWMNGTDGQPLPYVDSVIDQFRPDASVMVLDLRAGSLDIAKEVEAKDVAGIKSTTNLQFIPHAVAQHGYFGFGFSANAPAFKDKNLRLALQYAIDRDSMAKSLTFGLGTPHYVRRWAPG
jgi:ABC-type transport system substrate-binding protein